MLLTLFAAGIAIDRYCNVHWAISVTVAVISLASWSWIYQRRHFKVAVCCLGIGIIACGSFWHHGRWNWFEDKEIAAYCSNRAMPVCIRGRILGEPRHAVKADDSVFDPMPRNDQTIFRFEPTEIRNGDQWEDVAGRSTLFVHDKIEGVDFGDRVEVVGKLVALRTPTSPGQFDFQKFSRAKGELTALHARYGESIVVVEDVDRFSNAALLSDLRRWLNELIWKHVDHEQAGFASAILLGNREQLNIEHRERFLVTGTAHLLAISGLHVGILAGIFLFMYRIGFLGRRWALLLTIAFVIFYSWLVEFRPPVVRASVLLVLFCIGRLVGRGGSEFNLVALAGLVVLFINPADMFQLGPQLSFLAFATLVIFKSWIFPQLSQDPLDRLIRNSRPWPVRFSQRITKVVGQMVLVSLLIWFIGLPLVAANFHLVTPASAVVNPIVILPMAIGLFAGLGVCVFGGPMPMLADGCGWICGKCLGFVSSTIEAASSVSGTYWWTAGPTTASLLLFYGFLFGVVLIFQNHRELRIVCAWCILIVFSWLLPFQLDKFLARNLESADSDIKCTFVDVGHGSCVLFELPGGQSMLYDAGSLTSARFASTTIANLLWSKQIEHLDAIVISHADLDHFNAIPALVSRFSIGAVHVGYPMVESDSNSVSQLFKMLKEHGVPLRTVAWDDRVELADGSSITVLLPPEYGTGDNDNSNSVVLRIDAGGYRALLPGDLEKHGMQMLLLQPALDCDLVMMPHHGSKNSQPSGFLEWSKPERAVICASHSKLDPNVVSQIEAANCDVLATAVQGSMQFEFAEEAIRISTWMDGVWKPME